MPASTFFQSFTFYPLNDQFALSGQSHNAYTLAMSADEFSFLNLQTVLYGILAIAPEGAPLDGKQKGNQNLQRWIRSMNCREMLEPGDDVRSLYNTNTPARPNEKYTVASTSLTSSHL